MTAATPCWVSRDDAEPDFWPHCERENHPACWVGVEYRDGWIDWDDAPAACRTDQMCQPCELAENHAGAHVFEERP